MALNTYLYPEVWKQIIQQKTGRIVTATGMFTFRVVDPLQAGRLPISNIHEVAGPGPAKIGDRGYYWYLVSFTPRMILDQFAAGLRTKLFGFGAGVFSLIALGSWLLAWAITKRQIYQKQLKTMALYDALTGLPNRRLFYDALDAAVKRSKRYACGFGLLYIDLDGFKKVNDSLGHEAGDALLCEVGAKLKNAVRESDVVARMGGDEFTIIIDRLASYEGAQMVAGKIIALLSRPIILPQGVVEIGASVGISLFPLCGKTGEELLKQADMAMYHSKRRGKNTHSLFSPEWASELSPMY